MVNDSHNPYDDDAKAAADETNKVLAADEAKTAVSWDAIRKLLPDPIDQNSLNELIRIVNSATDQNEKVASLINNIGTLAGVVIKTLGQIR